MGTTTTAGCESQHTQLCVYAIHGAGKEGCCTSFKVSQLEFLLLKSVRTFPHKSLLHSQNHYAFATL